MAGKVISTGNKDLSCLRCRKKKAKCSKTRPTCTRCSRSNQPCEYPDAPPNLTDLSQKVLTLYDTLKELEGEFLVKYMQTSEEDKLDKLIKQELEESEPQPKLQLQHATQQFDVDTKPMMEEPSGWSMSLTPQGLSIHTVTRNLSEFNEFIKTISGQVIRDFGAEYLPALWDPDAEGYFEQESDTEELEEDEYLVTVPVFCTRSLLCRHQEIITPLKEVENEEQIKNFFPEILQHVLQRYKSLEKQDNNSSTTTVTHHHHLIQLMLQLEGYLRLSYDTRDELSSICVITAYIIFNIYFTPTLGKEEILPLHDCICYIKMIYLDYILRIESIPSEQLILCSILLGWIEHSIIPIAIRLLCNSDWKKKQDKKTWQLLIASLIYLDIESAIFQFKCPYDGKGVMKSVIKLQLEEEEPRVRDEAQTVIILEAKLMCLLNKVVTLFYQVEEQQQEVKVRKIDVDEVLTLVRDMEIWEEELPNWAKWNVIKENKKSSEFIVHMHMIYNMVKILLFRPFSITVNEHQEEQTLTKTTFLDMSIQAADKLTTCLIGVSSYQHIEHWTTSACNLVTDVTERVTKMFDKDEEIVDQLEKIQSRLQIKRITTN